MARSSPDRADDGFATAAAAMTSLVLAIGATAIAGLALSNLRSARIQLERTQADARLAGGQVVAALDVSENIRAGRLRWRETVGQDGFDILAEPERDKFNVTQMLTEKPNLLSQLGAENPTRTAAWLIVQAQSDRPATIADAASSRLWKDCAGSVLSYFGGPNYGPLKAAGSPDSQAVRGRTGEVWRIRVSSNGWMDDRIVRLTGNGRMPALTILRQFGRDNEKGEPCNALIAGS
jgi:multidrug efflux pump subunit AcrA (membrane-fusion protein)